MTSKDKQVLVTQSCPTLCDPMDCSPPDSSVHGIYQATILEWVAIFSFMGSFQPRNQTRISCISHIGKWILYHWATWEACHTSLVAIVQSCLTLWNPSRLLCPWNLPGNNIRVGCHFLLQGNFLTQGLNPHLLHWQAVSLPLVPPGKPTISRSLLRFMSIESVMLYSHLILCHPLLLLT